MFGLQPENTVNLNNKMVNIQYCEVKTNVLAQQWCVYDVSSLSSCVLEHRFHLRHPAISVFFFLLTIPLHSSIISQTEISEVFDFTLSALITFKPSSLDTSPLFIPVLSEVVWGWVQAMVKSIWTAGSLLEAWRTSLHFHLSLRANVAT